MWTHQRDWAAAMRVAEKYAPQSVGDVLAAQAASHAEANEWGKAEATFVKAKRPEAAVDMYRRARMWDDALRVASDYVPAKKHEIALEARLRRKRRRRQGQGGKILRRGGRRARAGTRARDGRELLRRGGRLPGTHREGDEGSERVGGRVGKPPFASPPNTSRGKRARWWRRRVDVFAAWERTRARSPRGVPRRGRSRRGGVRTRTESGRVGPGRGAAISEAAKRFRSPRRRRRRRVVGIGTRRIASRPEISPECASTYSVKHANMELRGGDPAAAAAVLMTAAPPRRNDTTSCARTWHRRSRANGTAGANANSRRFCSVSWRR